MSRPEFDERDAAILAARLALYNARTGPECGDWIVFANGVTRRISHVWNFPEDESGPAIFDVQTSNEGGGYYFGDHGVSFSGSLYRSVKGNTLALTDERRDGCVWIFHHDYMQAHNGVEATIPFRVYTCTENAPE